jgi:NAD(P)-dependent dehydrogenase (short-subunit alcohol dehydrogenase family)
LTGALIDLIQATSGSRIVNVSSVAHKRGNIDFDDLNWDSREYKPWQAYSDSKIANIYFTRELGKRIGNGTIATMAHPGWTATELQRNTGLVTFLNNFFAQNISMGALPTLYAACAPDVKNGDYFGPSGMGEMRGYPKKAKIVEQALDSGIAEKLWAVSEKMTATKYLS